MSTFKLSKIAMAVGVLLASQNASAVDVYVSGASALASTMPRLLNKFCKPTGRELVQAADLTTASLGNKNRTVYSCTFHDTYSSSVVATELGNLAGEAVNVYHSVEPGVSAAQDKLVGGSITGIIPLISGNTAVINFPDRSSKGSSTGTDSTFAGAVKYIASTSSAHSPNIGLTDVEPAMFTALNGNIPTYANAAAEGWTLPGGITNPGTVLTSDVVFQGTFGVAASYNAYQYGITNLSEIQLAALLNGGVNKWSKLGFNGTVGTKQDQVVICRRTPGSGTQAVFNALVNRVGCGANKDNSSFSVFAGNVTKEQMVTKAGISGGRWVVENATTSDVESCLDAAKGAGLYAIGIIGAEKTSNAAVTTATKYQFIDINGVRIEDRTETAGNTIDGSGDGFRKDRVISGQYPLVVSSTVQKSTVTGAVPTGLVDDFYTLLKSNAGDPLFTKTLPGIVSVPASRTGTFPNLADGASNYERGISTCNPLSWNN